jgi:hypothetical protein
VTPVVGNATPVLATNAALTVDEGASGTITTAHLQVTDPDNPPMTELQYSVTTLPVNGTLSVNGVDVTATGATFTQADIDGGLVSYQHDGSSTISDGFDFTFTDGIVAPVGPDTFNIIVTPSGGGSTMHVGDLGSGGVQAGNGGKWDATVDILIDDNLHGSLGGATVQGSWSNGASGSDSCVTIGGSCSITKTNIHRNSSSVTFTVNDVTNGGTNNYQQSDNHDDVQTNGESNGTSIIINDDGSVTPPLDNGPPTAPTGLSATGGNASVFLDWNNNGESDLDGYNVHRSTSAGPPYTQLNGSLVASSNYVDSTVTNGTTYYYVVTAVDTSADESGISNEASATPQASGGSDAMHLGDLSGVPSTGGNGGKWNATVFITVHDEIHDPVGSATVNGSWSNGASGSATCNTDDITGQCAVTKSNINKKSGRVTFTLDRLTKSGFTDSGPDDVSTIIVIDAP